MNFFHILFFIILFFFKKHNIEISLFFYRCFEFGRLHRYTLARAANAPTFREKLQTIQFAAVQVIGQFFGARGLSEVKDIDTTELEQQGPLWIEYTPNGRTKTSRVTNDYRITQRHRMFIVGKTNCEIINLLCTHRDPSAGTSLFLRAKNNVTEDDDVWFSNQKVGKSIIGQAVSKFAAPLMERREIENGHYTNTSMRKMLADRLFLAGAPEAIIASAIGHYSNSCSNNGFRHSNLANYVSGMESTILRKKIAVLMHKSDLRWADVEDDALFFSEYVAGNSPAGVLVCNKTLDETLAVCSEQDA